MNEVVPDWLHREDTTRASGTAMPNTVVYTSDGELNVILTRENHALKDEIERLKAENAELRKKFMTNMERIQTADKHTLASYLYEIYTLGPYVQAAGADDPTSIAFDSVDCKRDGGTDLTPIIQWLDRTEWD